MLTHNLQPLLSTKTLKTLTAPVLPRRLNIIRSLTDAYLREREIELRVGPSFLFGINILFPTPVLLLSDEHCLQA